MCILTCAFLDEGIGFNQSFVPSPFHHHRSSIPLFFPCSSFASSSERTSRSCRQPERKIRLASEWLVTSNSTMKRHTTFQAVLEVWVPLHLLVSCILLRSFCLVFRRSLPAPPSRNKKMSSKYGVKLTLQGSLHERFTFLNSRLFF